MKDALTSAARRLRSNSTEAEKYLWQALRSDGLGVKFRRQEIIGRYIVDFVCFEKLGFIRIKCGAFSVTLCNAMRNVEMTFTHSLCIANSVIRFFLACLSEALIELKRKQAKRLRKCLNTICDATNITKLNRNSTILTNEPKLVIEVDGGQHCHNQSDCVRDEWFSRQGFRTLRFWNNDVLENLDGVVQKIEEGLKIPSLSLPTRGRVSQLA